MAREITEDDLNQIVLKVAKIRQSLGNWRQGLENFREIDKKNLAYDHVGCEF